MATLPMIYVLPFTGADRDLDRICLICKAQSAAAIAAFVKLQPHTVVSENPHALELIEAIQALSDRHPELQSSVVIQVEATVSRDADQRPRQRFEPRLREDLLTLVRTRRLSILLAGLPPGGLPDSVPVRIESQTTVMLYRNRQMSAIFEDLSLRGVTRVTAPSSPAFQEIDRAAAMLVAGA